MTGVITHLLTGMDHQVRCFCLKISLKIRRLIISLPLNAGGYYRSFRHIPGRNQSFRQNSSFRHAWGEFNVAMFCGASTVCYPLDFSKSKVREIWDMPWPDGRGSPVSIDDLFLSENDPPRVTHGMRLMIPFLQGQDHFDIIVIVFFGSTILKKKIKNDMSKSWKKSDVILVSVDPRYVSYPKMDWGLWGEPPDG